MTMFLAPYTAIADIDGSPLDAGFLFFGEYNKDPELFPVQVYWDADFTVPAAQPIRTRNGYPVRNGSPTKVYLKTAQHSIVIKNRNGAFVLVDFKNRGWDASFVVDASGETQQAINNETIRFAETIADLLAIKKPKDGQVVSIKGYYKPTNFALAQPFKGGGVFSYVASRSADNDGVTVFNGWVRQYEYLNLYMAGAKGDAVADDTAAVQRAVDYAQQNNIAINALEGTYLVDEINVASTNPTTYPLNMTGSGWWATVFEARTVGQRSIFNLSGNGVTTLSQFHTFSHFKLMGRVRAQVGFYSLCAPHLSLDHIYSMGFSEWGLFYLKESWSVNISGCRSSYNAKHGGYIGSNANGMNIDGCFFFICEEWGLVIDGGLSVNIKGSGIERNKSGGIYANFVRNLNIIDTYFELNAENGVVLSPYTGIVAPDITIKTNILLNGTIGFETHGDKYLALPEGDVSDFKCKSVRIAGASLQTSFDDVSLVDVIGVNGLAVSDVVSLGPKKDTAVGVRVFASESRTLAKDVSIERMIGFNFPLVGFNNTPIVTNTWQDGYNSIKFGQQYNLINPDLTQLVDLRYSTTGPVLAITDANKYYKGRKVFTAKSSAVSENRTRGKGWIINAADAEWAEFRGKSVYVTCLAKVYGGARLQTYYNKDIESTYVPALTTAQSNTWYQRRTITIKFPETGTLEFGFYMSNILNIETDYAEVSQLVVAPVGVDSRDL